MKTNFKFKLNWKKCNYSEDYMPVSKALVSKGFGEKNLTLKYNAYIRCDKGYEADSGTDNTYEYRWDLYSEESGEEELVNWCHYFFDTIEDAQKDFEEFWVYTVMEMFSEGTLTKN